LGFGRGRSGKRAQVLTSIILELDLILQAETDTRDDTPSKKIQKPMDDLFDAMLYDKDSPEGRAARNRLYIQHPGKQKLPDRIDAFFTRDVATAGIKNKVQVVQGGFLVARSSMEHFEMYQSVIREANYSARCGDRGGWGGLGYGCMQGAMHYQGVVAYFYDQIYPGHAVELDVCRWNQVAHDVIYRGPKQPELIGACRQYPPDGDWDTNWPEKGACHDCRTLPVEETMTVHFTACSKPWQCKLDFPEEGREESAPTNATTCGLLFREYFGLRKNLDDQLKTLIGKNTSNAVGKYYPEYFLGYCSARDSYEGMDIPDDFEMSKLYGF
jgi:hypothetical protein